MKKLVLAILVMAGLSATAQDHDIKSKRGTMKDLSPEQVATLQTKKMTLALDLNETQQSKLKSIFIEEAKMRKSRMEDFKAQKEDGKKLTAEERYKRQNERLDHQIERKNAIKSILGAEQYAKWEKMDHHKKRKFNDKRKDHKKERRMSRE
ncbi:hypothetical protein Q2T41_05655 [Maribacter confluentis]|uniref:DUF4890 domain-containing protein n=1 Tax=Maribacter confluentis TaxID=1656093 RepID=A0ABT8RML7_9FLAO|nr:hypothetical protein [Maribacter confluentis]MDO1512138.1 hypothetical protein [Maribacter confluentis]